METTFALGRSIEKDVVIAVPTMKAALVTRYGSADAVRIEELPKPQPKPGEVLIKVHAATVSAADWRIRSASVPRGFGLLVRLIFGLRGPRQPVLGTELSGVVEQVGAGVDRFAPGDRVFAFPGAKMGAHAEYVVMPQHGNVLHVPPAMNLTDAAALCFGGMTALYFLRDKAKVRPGEKVLIVGAAGSVGSAAVELAKYFGAEVTGVCSGSNQAFVKGLGADHVIDYGARDFTKNGQKYDVIMDCVGAAPFARCRGSLAAGGRLLLVVATMGEMLAACVQSRGGLQVLAGGAPEKLEDMVTLAELCERGAFHPHIGATFAFEQIAAAHALVESQHKRGNAVVLFSSV
jgi:NADPH:quinone reductase-like Zn-dependent oxidoreductase